MYSFWVSFVFILNGFYALIYLEVETLHDVEPAYVPQGETDMKK